MEASVSVAGSTGDAGRPEMTSPVSCAGCGDPVAYLIGEGVLSERTVAEGLWEDRSYGEWRETGLGMCFNRTHPVRECVELMRERVGGKKITPPLSAKEKMEAEALRRKRREA